MSAICVIGDILSGGCVLHISGLWMDSNVQPLGRIGPPATTLAVVVISTPYDQYHIKDSKGSGMHQRNQKTGEYYK